MPSPFRSRPPGAPPARLLPALALANAGGVIGYLPLLTLLLPIRVEQIVPNARVGVLAACGIAGGVAASLANIAFGWASDRACAAGRGRRRGLGLGIAATLLAYAVLAAARTPAATVAAVVGVQVGVNAVLAPLMAMIAEEVPDARKGLGGGLLALGTPAAALLASGLVAWTGSGLPGRLAVVAAAFAACAAPLLFTRGPAGAATAPAAGAATPRPGRRDLAVAWGARLLVQVAGNVLFSYLLYYLESAAPEVAPAALARRAGALVAAAYLLPVPLALAAGAWSDRSGRRKPALVLAAAVATGGLLAMAQARGWYAAALAFGTFAVGWGVFMPLQATFAMQLLPDPRHRGRDLGLVNLANTVPALAGPVLVWALADAGRFGGLLLVLAATTAAGGLLVLAAGSRR